MKIAAIILAAILAAPAHAEQYSNDDLCRAIGETSRAAVQPRDRLFFEKNCECFEGLGCMEKGGAMAKAAAETVAKVEEQRRKTAEAEKARRAERVKAKAAAEKRAAKTCGAENDAWWTCARTPGQTDCTPQVQAFEACCTKAGVPDRMRCSDLFP